MDVLVGLDAGTTATKAVTAGAAAVVRDVVSIGYPLLVPSPGWAELDAPRLVRAAVEALTEVVRAAQERGDRVVGLSLSAAMHGLVPMTSEGTPLAPLATWADSRASAQAAALRADGRAQGLHARTGTPVHPMSPMVKLAWWSEHDPELLRTTARWGGVKELLVAALCGRSDVVDLSCASASGGYDLAAAAGTRGAGGRRRARGAAGGGRPDDVRPGRPALGRRAGHRAARRPARRDRRVRRGAGQPRHRCRPAERGAVSLGTSGAMRVVVPRPVVDPAGRCSATRSPTTTGSSAAR
jgi:gluconokinase